MSTVTIPKFIQICNIKILAIELNRISNITASKRQKISLISASRRSRLGQTVTVRGQPWSQTILASISISATHDKLILLVLCICRFESVYRDTAQIFPPFQTPPAGTIIDINPLSGVSFANVLLVVSANVVNALLARMNA